MHPHHRSLGRILNAATVGKPPQIRAIIHENDESGTHSTTHIIRKKSSKDTTIETRGAPDKREEEAHTFIRPEKMTVHSTAWKPGDRVGLQK